jgi:hypothetical protein
MGMAPELVDDFTDFREGYFGASEVRLSEAIKLFMADRLKNEPASKSDMRKRERSVAGQKTKSSNSCDEK